MQTETYTTCPCNHCSEKIQFQDSHAGETVNCPHCGLETTLFLPLPQIPDEQRAPFKPEAATKRTFSDPSWGNPKPPLIPGRKKAVPTILGTLCLFIGGAIAFFVGFAFLVEAQSVMHQIAGIIPICTGAILIGLAFVVDGLRSITKNQ